MGGVNEKIECYYGVCGAIGMADRQGTIFRRGDAALARLGKEVNAFGAADRREF